MEKEYLSQIYRLWWDTENVILHIAFNKEFTARSKEILAKTTSPFMEMINNLLGGPRDFESFAKTNFSFGFENVFGFKDESEAEFLYAWEIEATKKHSTKKCRWCRGSGKNNNSDTPCYSCDGSGKGFEDTKNNFHSGMMTLYTMTRIASILLLKDNGLSAKKQALHAEFSQTSGMHNCWSGGWVSKEVMEWLSKASNHEEKEIVRAMASSEKKLLCRNVDERSFRLSFQDDGRFWLQVPGNACTLGTERGINTFMTGEQLSPHNVDHRFQQIAFVAGLAKMHELYESSLI